MKNRNYVVKLLVYCLVSYDQATVMRKIYICTVNRILLLKNVMLSEKTAGCYFLKGNNAYFCQSGPDVNKNANLYCC